MRLADLADETGADGTDEHVLHEVEVHIGVDFGEEAGGVREGEADVGEAVGGEVGFGHVDVVFLFDLVMVSMLSAKDS